MPFRKLKKYLDDNHVHYVSISHSPAYTAQEIAASAHIPGREVAKTVMVKLDGRLAMAVLPADYQIDFRALRTATGAHDVELADEVEFRDMFPECELGAMPPFGNLWELPVYTTESLMQDEEIAFNAGSHTELIKLSTADYKRLVHPEVIRFSAR